MISWLGIVELCESRCLAGAGSITDPSARTAKQAPKSATLALIQDQYCFGRAQPARGSFKQLPATTYVSVVPGIFFWSERSRILVFV